MSVKVVLLHGALGSKGQIGFLKDWLTDMNIDSSVFEFSGHGSTPPSDEFGVTQFAHELESYLSTLDSPPIVFGYSMGGYVAAHLGAFKPTLFGGLVTLATKFSWSREIASNEVKMLAPDIIREKVPAFAEVLQKRHESLGWEEVCKNTANMMIDLGNKPSITAENLKDISFPTLFAVGDQDKMVSIEETEWARSNTATSSFAVLPMTKHPIERLSKTNFEFLIRTLIEKLK